MRVPAGAVHGGMPAQGQALGWRGEYAQGAGIGWTDGTRLYLLPSAAAPYVIQKSADSGAPIEITARAMGEALEAAGLHAGCKAPDEWPEGTLGAAAVAEAGPVAAAPAPVAPLAAVAPPVGPVAVDEPVLPEPEPEPETAPAPSRQASRKPRPEPTVCASIADRVAAALEKAGGDVDKATAALIKTAIPDGMELLESTRVSARYDFTAHPPEPEILRKPSKNGANEVWEARPKWTNPSTPDGTEVQLLDVNAAYLSALNTHLPIGGLQHATGGEFDRRRSGLYLITPPEWTRTDLPNPLGSRELSGDLWVTRPTLQLLMDAASEKFGRLCDAPVIHESWTSGSSESILRAFRIILRDARAAAIESGDEVTLAYVKAMYSKFISTSAKASKFNHLIERTDWSQIIRAQAHGNLWRRAFKAHPAGLTVHRITGTDELHVAGDWRAVFAEGRGLTEMKTKGAYVVGAPVTEMGE
ncbi:transcriptional regulator [Streptomyces chattanoogensis]|uniref:transcriptional regulator n=1 Tax=Streptomyces chattanoogensis TaxID=66876 RepID=UPI0012FF467E|nr:transcriptional regulator [Streptomyces chattanoogensis]